MILICIAYFFFPSRSPLGNIPQSTCGELCSSPVVLSSAFSSQRTCKASVFVFSGAPFIPSLRSPLFPHEVANPLASHADRLLNQLTYVPPHIAIRQQLTGVIQNRLLAAAQDLHPRRLDEGEPAPAAAAAAAANNQNQIGGAHELKIPYPITPIRVLVMRGLNERFEGLKVLDSTLTCRLLFGLIEQFEFSSLKRELDFVRPHSVTLCTEWRAPLERMSGASMCVHRRHIARLHRRSSSLAQRTNSRSPSASRELEVRRPV